MDEFVANAVDPFKATGVIRTIAAEIKKRVRKEKLSIYLAKENYKDAALVLKTENVGRSAEIKMAQGSAVLYMKREIPGDFPPWTKLFTTHQTFEDDFFGRPNTVGGVLIVHEHNRLFALSFGTGFHLLKDEHFERDFGLKVTLNSVDPERLRSLDKSSYDHNPLNSRTQSPREVTIFDLHIDSEMELVYALTGACNVPVFGSHITGRDALTLVTETSLDKLSSILKESLSRYEAKLPDDFEWIDNVYRVRDHEEIQICDLELNDALKTAPNNSLYLGEPEVVDWEGQIGYSFDCHSNTPRHVVLDFGHFIEHLNRKVKPKEKDSDGALIEITTDVLRTNYVHVNNNEYQSIRSWPVYKCLYAEIKIGTQDYILRNGVWYKVAKDFAEKIDTYLKERLHQYGHSLPTFAHDGEGEYNVAVASGDKTYHLWDKKNIQIGGKSDKIEFCDLTKDDTDVIHVKYYRSSQTLSHLFSQGYVSAHSYVADQGFRERLNLKLSAGMKLTNCSARPDISKLKIVYAIATTKSLPNELPFFAKVSLKQALKSLNTLGYEVYISKIDVDAGVLVKKKIKPKKPPKH